MFVLENAVSPYNYVTEKEMKAYIMVGERDGDNVGLCCVKKQVRYKSKSTKICELSIFSRKSGCLLVF